MSGMLVVLLARAEVTIEEVSAGEPVVELAANGVVEAEVELSVVLVTTCATRCSTALSTPAIATGSAAEVLRKQSTPLLTCVGKKVIP